MKRTFAKVDNSDNASATGGAAPAAAATTTSSTSAAMSAARRFFVGGNWKCNGDTASVKELVDGLNAADMSGAGSAVDVVVAPVALHLALVKTTLRDGIAVAAQNCWHTASGAFTGEIGAPMLSDLGVDYVVVGHSERRHVLGETDELLVKKVLHALEHKLRVIFCIGETGEQRDAGATNDVVFGQVDALVRGGVTSAEQWANIVLAYEPVWAIGTGKTATPELAQEVHAALRRFVSDKVSANVAGALRIIYGGSVKPANCDALAAQVDIDGFLVGGASLKAADFASIVASHTKSAS